MTHILLLILPGVVPHALQGWHEEQVAKTKESADMNTQVKFLDRHITLRIDSNQLATIDEIAASQNVNRGSLIRLALKKLVENQMTSAV